MEPGMRTVVLLSLTFAVACGGTPRRDEPQPSRRVAAWDTATARRICVSPDSVIAGLKDCVLLDQGRRRDVRRPAPPPRE
jgi:hypothetical protein